MDRITKDKLAINFANSWKMASNWVAVTWGTLLAVTFALPSDVLALLVSRLPVPPWTVPVVVAVIGVGARMWPQKSITSAVAAAKSDDSRA